MIFLPLLLAVDSLIRPLGAMPAGITDGWAATLHGERFSYQSAHPTAHASLLVRAVDSTNYARWITAPVRGGAGAMRHIAFLAAMDVTDAGQAPVRFWMSVNGHRFALPQPTSSAAAWKVEGVDGITLHFRRLMTDKYGDTHGIFTLDVPAAIAPTGKPVTLQVQGDNAGRQSWFILYTVSLAPTIAAHGEQLLAKSAVRARQSVRLDAWDPFDSVDVVVSVHGVPPDTQRLAVGATTFRIMVPAVRKPTTTAVTVRGRGVAVMFNKLPLAPVVPREVYLINHAHLDIGYTDVQPMVQAKHERTLDSALADIRASDSNPPGERFVWNEEGLWPLEHYLVSRPAADTARLLAAVRRGDMALSGVYANVLTGLSGGEELIHLLDYARFLRRVQHVPVRMAMTSDVPGFTWGMVPALGSQGIRYLSSGPNEGDRIGNVLKAWGDKPFWWIGPSGRDSLLVMFAGKGYSWVFNWPAGRLRIEDANVMSDYMDSLTAHHYPWNIVQVRVAIGGDNGIPDAQLAGEVREWNRRFASPRLIIATLPEMFDSMAARYGSKLPKIRGDLTGFWEDGAVSSLREEILARQSAARLVEAQTVAAMRGEMLPATSIDSAWADVLLWDEHTWGADVSISEPDSPMTKAQWAYKQHFALAADSTSRDLLDFAARGLARRGLHFAGELAVPAGAFDIINTHEVASHGLVMIPRSLSEAGNLFKDANDNVLTSQRRADGDLAAVRDLAPLDATRIVPAKEGSAVVGAGPTLTPAQAAGDSLWNGLVVVHVDTMTGAIASVRWRGHELVDRTRGGWGRYRYVAGRDTSKAQDAGNTVITVLDAGPLVATLRVVSDAPGAQSLRREISLEAGSDAIEITTHLDKKSVRTKEAVHIAFPLNVPHGTVRMEQAWAIVRPDIDQADGANRNLYPVQRWLDASNADFGVTIVTPDLPLWELNGLTAEAFDQPEGRQVWLRHSLPGTELIAYAMSNYWHTNYKADQPGPVTFRVVLVPHGPFDAVAATRTAMAVTEPPIFASASGPDSSGPLLQLSSDRIIVSSVSPIPDSAGWMVRLWNPDTVAHSTTLRWRKSSGVNGAIEVPAMGFKTVRVAPVGAR
ncbi:MAG: glycoside hydrolase family 38 C-terminal domain-containing protein [Gemmatimonadales bacterium]